ncbi:glycosyl hydrolase [Stachybotrys elegans]|uniref:Glycosyl hydrolase n=1 Tax=Stachybotrys elegans TaxID=80388 RepID=A0A8K0S8U4_9HYPO|nr:glycosyl hydrolase [Stachybotrys elegans]
MRQVIFWLTGFAAITAATATKDYTLHVDPFIGTEGPVPGSGFQGGNVFPGATVPFGAVKVGIDTTRWNVSFSAGAGYTPSGNVTAISMLHLSGTGGPPTYGLIPQMPLTSLEGVNLFDNITYMQSKTEHDVAEVGYFKTSLESGVVAEMSASMHAGIMRYSFPETGEKHILVDLSHFIPSTGKYEQFYSNSRMEVSEDGTQYSGYGVYRGGWVLGGDYNVYFCAKFDTAPSEAKLFSGIYTDPYWPNTTNVGAEFTDATSLQGGRTGYQWAKRVGGLFTFPANSTTIQSKVGISWISSDKACQFIHDEIPHWDLETTVAQAKDKWNAEVLSKIDLQTNNSTLLTMFYTGLYHANLMPSDRTGENPYWESDEPYYDDFYTLWDTFRCTHALTSLILPEREVDIIRSMIDIWRHERFMPEGRAHNYNGRAQGGSNSDNVLADAYVKKVDSKGLISWEDGYKAMKTNAEIVPWNTFDVDDPTGSTQHGRSGLEDWKTRGFISINYGRSVSKTVEYSLNDFAVSQVARGQAPDEVEKYLERAANWQNIWDTTVEAYNFTGFLAPYYPNGTLAPYHPLTCGTCSWSAITYEGTPWEYSFTVPHDMSTLIQRMGGPQQFEDRLDTSFQPGLGEADHHNDGIGSMIFNPGNEPSFMTPFLYNYVKGRQWKSVMRSRALVDTWYHDGPNGIPGNEDAGSMSSWLIWNIMGLYPVVTQPVYLILSPRVEAISIRTGDGLLRVTARGLEDGPYIQSLKVNGEQWNKSWVTHEDLPAMWDDGDLPPSPGSQ